MDKRFYVKDDSPLQQYPPFVKKSSSSMRMIVFFLLFIIVVAALFIGIYLLNKNAQEQKPAVVVQAPTSAPTPTPEPTTEATPSGSLTPSPTGKAGEEVSKVSVEVLNGSGTPGAAGGIAKTLRDLGYTVAGTGNADSFTYQDITIRAKKSQASALAKLKKDLSESYTVGKTTSDLPESSSYDIEVIVGK